MGKNLSKLFSGGATASSASFLLRYSSSFDDPVSKFISYRRVQSKRAVLQQVMLLIDSYSCSCPMLVMLLCTCCEPGNGLICMILCHFVCVRAAFAFVFVDASGKANNAKVIVYYVAYYTV